MKNASTHKLCNQPFSSLSSCLMCWMDSILFYFSTTKQLKISILCDIMYIKKKINDYIYFMHIVVGMAPLAMQLCTFPWPSPCTLFWTSLLAGLDITLFVLWNFQNLRKKTKKHNNNFFYIYLIIDIEKILIWYFFAYILFIFIMNDCIYIKRKMLRSISVARVTVQSMLNTYYKICSKLGGYA